MIKIAKVIDQIVEKCFSQDEKDILEFYVGTRKITVASQLKTYYSTACWRGDDLEVLFDVICIIKEERKDLLKKIKSLNDRINVAIDPSSYDETYVKIVENRSSTTSINVGSDNSSSSSRNSENTTSEAKADSWSLGTVREAGSEMDEVNKLSDVWEERTLSHGSNQDAPNITKADNSKQDIRYRQFSTSSSFGEDVSTSRSSDLSTSDGSMKGDTTSSGVNINKHTGGRNVGGRKSIIGEQLVNMWKDELPNLRNAYWLIFNDLFIYETDY